MFSYEVSPSEYDGFTKTTLVDEYAVPSNALGFFASQGSKFNVFKLTAEDREILFVTYIPETMSHTVNQEEAEKNISGAIVYTQDRDDIWYLPSEVVEENPYLPELRQAFHEGRNFDEREADYRYHFPTGETTIAVPSSNPIDRPEREYTVTAIEYLGGYFPRKFLMETESGETLYLRERAGSIRLIDDGGDGEEIFNAYVGREHPGMNMSDDEVLNIVSAVDYLTIVEGYDTEVSEETKDDYWGDFEPMTITPDDLDDDEISEIIDEDIDIEGEGEEWAEEQPDEPHPSEVEDSDEE